MKKGSLLDRIATWSIRTALLIAFNQAVYPKVLNNWAESWQRNGEPRVKVDNLELPCLENKSLDARNYLDLANSIVHQNVLEGAVCRDYTKANLEVYKKLLKQAGKENLINCVRSAFDGGFKGGHNWAEIFEGGDWIKYETMHESPVLTAENVREHSDLTENQRTRLNGNPNRKAHLVCYSNDNCHPTLDAYFSPGGNLALLTRAFLRD